MAPQAMTTVGRVRESTGKAFADSRSAA